MKPTSGFTSAQIASVNVPSAATAPSITPKFDPTATTMQTLPTTEVKNPGLGSKIGSDISGDVSEGANALSESASGKENPFAAGATIAKDVTGAVAAPIAEPVNEVLQKTGISGLISKISDKVNDTKAMQDFTDMMSKHPVLAGALSDTLQAGMNTGMIAGGAESAEKVGEAVKNTLPSTEDIGASSKPLTREEEVTNAVKPEETGKAKVNAYKNVVKGNRTAGETGILKTQSLNPSEANTQLGQRLSDIDGLGAKGNTHLDNLKVLGKALNDTEDKIGEITANDTTTGTKEELKAKLEDLKTNKPTEYQGIKEPNGKLYNKVVDFAKGVVDKNDESTEGFRDGRTAFDTQAKTEFPSAYKNGTIDVNSPAGAAIKAVRDGWNRYTYDSSSRGSELESAVKRENDIFIATENIAPQAAAQDGSGAIGRYLDAHPGLDNAASFLKRVSYRAAAGGVISGVKSLIKG